MKVNFYFLGFGNDFLDMIPKAKVKEKVVKLDFIKIKNNHNNNKNTHNFHASKNATEKIERQSAE